MSASAERDRAADVAALDYPKALAGARVVSQPWYRCQALAWVARFAPESMVAEIAGEALAAAARAEDPYQQVGAAAWPVRALIERGHVSRAILSLGWLVEASGRIAHPVSRVEALSLLLQATWPLGGANRRGVLSALIGACRVARSWRAGRAWRDAALMLAAEGEEEARQLIAAMPEGSFKG